MKNLKKVLALVVALTMVLTTVAFASYPDVDANADYAGAVELLSALSVLEGDETGNFNPDNTITRAEFAAVVCRALGLENSANSAKGTTIFTDVAADHWASGYINLASQQGIVNGKGNDIFDPEGNVTFAEAVKMLVVALGYEPMAAQKGGYPTGYLTVANSTKMTAGVSSNGTDAAALRSTVAQLTANAMEIPVMDQTGFGTETTYEVLDDYDNYQTLLTNMDIYVATGVVGDTDKDTDKVTFNFTEASDDFEFGYNSKGEEVSDVTKLSKDFNINGSNIETYYQQNVNAYVYKENKSDYSVIIAVPSGIGTTLTINASDLDDANATISKTDRTTLEYYESKDATKTTKIYVEEDPMVYVNGIKVENLVDFAQYSDDDVVIQFVENTDDKYYDRILVTYYSHAIVDTVDVAKERITFLQNSIIFDSDDDTEYVTLKDAEGNAIELADIKSGDVLAMEVGDLIDASSAKPAPKPAKSTAWGDTITITDLGQNSVTGTLDEANDDYITIGGTDYEVGEFVDGNDGDVFDDIKDVSSAKLGTEGLFYIGISGKIIGFDGTAGSNGNYGYILQAAESDSNSFNDGFQVKMLTTDNGIVTFDVYRNFEIANSPFADVKSGTYNKDTAADKTVLTALFGKAGKYGDKTAFKADPLNRVVEYKTTSSDELRYIKFTTAAKNYNVINADDKEFKAATNKIDGKILSDSAIIFDLSNDDIDDAATKTLSYLVDEGTYKGVMFKKDSDSEYRVFAVTEGDSAFDAEAGICIATNVVKTKYNDDDAIKVTYLQDAETKTAIFTDDSDAKGGSADYSKLAKGDAFLVNAEEDGLVSNYAIIGSITNGKLAVDDKVFKAAYGVKDIDKDDDAAYFFGYIKYVSKKSVTLVDENGEPYDVIIGNNTNQYAYNSKNKNNIKIENGAWDVEGIDGYYSDDDGENVQSPDGLVNYAFVKIYDGEVTDIYSFTQRYEFPKANTDAEVKTEAAAPVEAPVAPADKVPAVEDEINVDFE